MIVDLLAFVVGFDAQGARFGGDGLGGFVGFEAFEQSLFTAGVDGVAETSVGEHQVVMRLDVLGVDGEYAAEGLNRFAVFALQEQDAAELV